MPASAVRLLRVIAGDEGQSDADLLGRFIDRRDEAAFALLVRRHAPMVWGVCRRILPTDQDAEDAFQATFLVLIQKARAVPREAVGNWLYGVARRAALLARRALVRRRERTGEMDDYPAPGPLDELRAALDEELSRLPDVYRTVIVLCDLEGRTRREAAAVLGWPEGTVAGRLVRARALLTKRLARHAPVVSVAALLAGTASARVPEVLPSTATIPHGIAALTREVLGVMARGKLMKTAVMILALSCAGFGMFLQAGQEKTDAPRSASAFVKPASGELPVKAVAADEVVWGKEVDGLQAGLAADTRTYRHGQTMKMEVKLRNVGKADVTITHGLLRESAPTITASDGVRMSVYMPPILGIIVIPTERVMKPGETITLYNPKVAVESEDRARLLGEMLVGTPTICVGPGKYQIAFGGMVHSHPKLTTGATEFEVKVIPPAHDTPANALAARHRVTVNLTKNEPWPRATRCTFLDNDRVLVQAGTDMLEVRDAKTGKLLKSVSIDKQFVGDFRVSADRKWVAAVTVADTTGTFVIPQPDVTVWDTATWKVRGTIHGRRLLDIAADGRTVLAQVDDGWAGKGQIEVWDVVERKALKAPFEFKRLDAAAISPDGSLVAVSGLNEIAYWKWRDGDKHDRLKVGRKVDALVFSPDGKFVAEGPDSRMTVEVRDVTTLKVAHELSDPAQPRVPQSVAGMVFADDGKTLVFGNGVGLIETIPVPHRIHFWDIKSGKLTLQINLKGGAPSSLDVSPDGKSLAAVTADGGVSLRVFDLDPADEPAPRK